MLKQTHRTIYIIFFFLSIISTNGQTVSATYSSGDIPTGDGSWPGGCTASTLNVTIPIGSTVTSVDVAYTFTAQNSGWRSEQRSQIYYQEGATSEGSYSSGSGNSGGTQSYNRTGLTLANGVTATGTLTFEMRAYRTWTGTAGCNTTHNKVNNNSWTITVNYIAPVGGHLGPGGVGNTDGTSNLVLWLNPDKGSNSGSLWTDQSGNGFDFGSGNGATFNTSDINGYNSYSFNGSNNYFEKSFESSLNPNSFSVFSVSNVSSSGTYKAVVSSRDDSNPKGFILYAVPSSNNWSFWTGPNASWQTTGTTTSTVGSWATQNLFYQNSASGKRLFINNSLNDTDTHSMTLNTTRPFRVGAGRNENPTPNYYFSGKMGEIIMFDAVLNTAERIIINNYLSAKYAFSLSSEDFYNEDTSGGNFDHKVAGIGQASDGSFHTDSQGTGIIRINTPSALSNGDFLFWGEAEKDANYDFSASLSSEYKERIDTKWRVSKTNNTGGDVGLGTVSFSVAAADLDLSGKASCASLRLIVDDNSDFSSITNTYTLEESGGIYTTTMPVSFSDNDYFTIEYVDQIVLDGATAYNGSGTSNKPNTTDDCYKLLVKSNTLTLTEDADVREIEVEASSILAVNSGFKLQVTNGINNNGDIRLVGTSQLVQTHTSATNLNSGTGNLYVDQKATTSSIYHSGYWSSPVSATVGAPFSINDVLKDGTVPIAATPTAGEAGNINFISGHDGNATSPIKISTRWLATFNNAADWTRYVSPTGAVLTPGLGWNMKSVGAPFTFKGKPNDGEYTFSISKDNYSLLGNPYPSALDVQKFITDNASQFKGELYIYNSVDNTHVRANYTGTYSTVVSGVGVGAGPFLPIGQAFFITREAAGTGTITFNNSQRGIANIADTGIIVAKGEPLKKAKSLSVLKIGFQFNLTETEKRNRQIAIAFRGLTNMYDKGFDAEMWALQPTDIYLKVEDREAPFIITGIEDFKKSIEVPLVVQLDAERDVTFSVDELKNIESTVYLLDKSTNTYYNLSEGSKTITLLKGKFTDRFAITFDKQSLSVNEDVLNSSFNVFHNYLANELVVKKLNTQSLKSIAIYTLTGQNIIELTDVNLLQKDIITLKTNKLAASVYIVKIITSKGILSKKLFIR